MKKTSFLSDFKFLALSIVISCVLLMPAIVHAGTFYSCVDREVDVQFVMDTGAEGTTISTDIADELYINLNKAAKAKARVVGGAIIDVDVVKIDSIKIGPHTI